MRRLRIAGLLLTALLTSSVALAQSGAITGTVVDESGAVMPGVTVEIASPALIEQSRTAFTDGAGVYRVIELRSGTYSVTFTLPGFAVVTRVGIELTAGFTATVNATLVLGSLEENITVSGSAPLVDTQNTVVQTRLGREELEALPLGQSLTSLQTLTLGVRALGGSVRDVGGNLAENSQSFGVKGLKVEDFQTFRDGMNIGSFMAGGNSHGSSNPSMFEEVSIQTGGAGVMSESVGAQVNMISKSGGNVFSGDMNTNFSHSALQSSNLDDALVARGATETSIRKRYDVHGSFGGPIKQDKLWFIVGARTWTSSDYLPGNFFNATQGTLFYTPDRSRPAYTQTYWRMGEGRLTWQATPRNQFTVMFEKQKNCDCFRGVASSPIAPEAAGHHMPTMTKIQGRWTSQITTRLLLQFGSAYQLHRIDRAPGLGGSINDRVVTELSTNYTYGGYGRDISGITFASGWQEIVNANQNLTLSYVTGRHNLQVGFRYLLVAQNFNAPRVAGPMDDALTFQFRNGVPESFTMYATPHGQRQRMDDLAFFAGDQWSLNRLTLNLGARIDTSRGSSPAQHLAAGPYVAERNFPAQKGLPNFKDFSPRLGAAYDVFGSGKTAIKAQLSRGVTQTSIGNLGTKVNQVARVVTTTTRSWKDTNGNFYPDCELRNPLANAECGQMSNLAFGTAVQNNFVADELLYGWGKRGYTWQGSLSVQHEVASGISMDASYFRTWHGNFECSQAFGSPCLADNALVGPADYDPYCVTAPVDPRLPGGGGQEICGLYDIKPEKFGQVETHTVPASRFGNVSRVYNGIEVNVRVKRAGYLLSGGLLTGAEVSNRCFVVDSPGELRHCRVAPPWSAGTELKFHGIAPLWWGVQLSGTLQVLPSIAEQANIRFTNAQIAPSLGRNLSGGVASISIPLLDPQTVYREGWDSQTDVRLMRDFTWGHVRLQPSVDIYNLFNANTVLRQQETLGPAYRNVISVLGPRVVKFGAQLTF